jgi:hypothetical protein
MRESVKKLRFLKISLEQAITMEKFGVRMNSQRSMGLLHENAQE